MSTSAIPSEWIEPILDQFPSPNSIWENYNCDLRRWLQLKSKFFDSGLLSMELLPPKPEIEDYTDVISEKTGCL